DMRRDRRDDLPRLRRETKAGDDLVRLPRQRLQDLFRLPRARRLAVRASVERDRRVDAEHRPLAGLREDRARLAERVLADELLRIDVRNVALFVARLDDVERDAELMQDRAPLWRGRCEQQRR